MSVDPSTCAALWIGGPAGSGKTTVARLIARRYDLPLYSTDPQSRRHDRQAADLGLYTPGTSPTYNRMPMILQDLRDNSTALPTVVEGAHLRPAEIPNPDAAVWLLPSRQEQRRRLELRHPDGIDPGMLEGYPSIQRALRGTSVRIWCPDGQTVEETVNSVASLLFQDR